MPLDFKSVAGKMKDEIKRPPLPPHGVYLFQVTKLPKIDTSKDQKWDIVDYSVRGVAPVADVDPDELTKYGGAERVFQNVRFMFNKEDEVEFQRTEYRHKQFLEEHLKCWEEGANTAQAMNASINKQFWGTISWKADKDDPETMFANITKTAPVG